MKKDLALKSLLGCSDVFSDICNVFIFAGKEVISADGRTEDLFQSVSDEKLQNALLEEYGI